MCVCASGLTNDVLLLECVLLLKTGATTVTVHVLTVVVVLVVVVMVMVTCGGGGGDDGIVGQCNC
jgi:hypothetical protein